MGLLFPALAAALAAIEMLLVLAGAIPLLAENAPANLAFSLAGFLVIFCAGWRANDAKAGAVEGLKVGGAVALVLLAFIGISRLVRIPLMGIQATDAVLAVIAAVSVLATLALAALIGCIAGFARSKKVRKGKEEKTGKKKARITAS